MILDFAATTPAPAARILMAGTVEALAHERDNERLPTRREYVTSIKGDLPQCLQSLIAVGLTSASQRNKTMVNLVLMLKSIGRSMEQTLAIATNWAEKIPEHLTSTKLRERVNAVRDTVRWAFNKQGTSGNCALIRDCGARCPGESACRFVAGTEQERSGDAVVVTLSEACEPKFSARKIRFKGVPVAVDQRPQLVPLTVKISCSPQDCDACDACPLSREKGAVIKMSAKQILKMSSLPDEDRFGAAFTRIARIPKRCPGHQYSVQQRAPLLLTLVQPAINGTAEALRENKVFFVGSELDDQTPYEFEGITYPHPRGHEAVQVATSARPLAEGFRSFVPPDDLRETLAPFRPRTWDMPGLKQKIGDVQFDWESNVHQIYGRELHAMMMSLVWFSPLEMMHGGRKQRGWLEVLAFGDTGQGKTEIAQRFLDFFGQGTLITGKNLSVAGLLAGVDRVDGRNIMRKGVMPRYDGSLVCIDEWGAVTDEIARAMTDKRSSGVARISKIISAEFMARNRLLLLANPVIGKNRRSCSMEEMPFGIQHVLPLMRSPEDVRRLDYTVGFRSYQRIYEEIHKKRASAPSPVYTQELSSLLVMWVWSRTAEQVVFDEDAEEGCLAASEFLSGETGYTRGVPLLMAGDTRYKIARIAAALAGLTFSTDDGETLRVRGVHVDLAMELLLRLYNGAELQYDLFSAADPSHKRLTWHMFKTVCMEIPRFGSIDVLGPDGRMVREQRWQAAMHALLASAFMSESDLRTMTGLKETGEFFSVLVRQGLLEKNVGGYKLNGRGVRVAKLMLRWDDLDRSLFDVEEDWFVEHKDEV